jgi:hypothetical protein
MRVRLAFVAITAATLATVACQPTHPAPHPGPLPTLPECRHESDDNCTWHADQHGNRSGLSFDVRHGQVRTWGPADYNAYEGTV